MAKVLLALALFALLGVAVALPASRQSESLDAAAETVEFAEIDADSDLSAELEARMRAESDAAMAAIAEADAEVAAELRAVTEPKSGETVAQFEAANVLVKAECATKCRTLSGISRLSGLGLTQGLECVTPCEECIDERVRLGTKGGDGSLRFNVLSLRCYATQTEQNRDSWRRYVLPTLSGSSLPPVPARDTANAQNGAVATLDGCKPACAKQHQTGDFFGRKAKGCVDACNECLDQLEQLGRVHFIPSTEKCRTYRYEMVVPKVDALTTQAAYHPRCAEPLPHPQTPSHFEDSIEPDALIYNADQSRRLDTMAVRAALRNWVQTQNTHVITDDVLCPGDILMRHSYCDRVDVVVAKLHRIEFQGSKAILDKSKGTPHARASAYPVHALMSLGSGVVGESVHPGVVLDETPNTDMWVYRPRDREYAMNAAKHMYWLTQQKIRYSTLSVVKASVVSVFESNPEFDPRSSGSLPGTGLSKARDVAANIAARKAAKIPDAMMCVEAVTNAFHAANFGTIPLIPQFAAPAVLEKYVHAHPEQFVFVGVLKSDVSKFYIPIGKL